MKKIVIHKPGSYERLKIETHPDPHPGPGEVLIDVSAIGVNYADCIIRMGLYASAKELKGYPITPGFEAAGKVIEVGAGVTGIAPGQSVMALTLFDGYSSKLVLPAERVFAIPEGISESQAAGFPTVFLTAWFALCEQARPRADDTVLIHSAAGGVGSALVQLAAMRGCHVVGVVGADHKVEVARQAGATVVIDKSNQDLWREAEAAAAGGYQAIFDANGVSTLGQSYEHLAPMGRLVIYGFHSMLPRTGGKPNWLKLAVDWLRTPRFNPLRMTAENRSVMACNLSFLGDNADYLRQGMLELLGWLAEGKIRPAPVIEYAFENVASAHKDIESGQTTGKLVLRVK
ncbi:MAG: medium chain dehydrogenase/reductase family protein [Gammaproteobacteria bacterium]|nr:medium chain dehydrogenase/reductase family protein [Gammaproteobacteria bacterium]